MKYVCLVFISITLGYFVGLRHAYYQTKQIKAEIKEAIVKKTTENYEAAKKKVTEKLGLSEH